MSEEKKTVSLGATLKEAAAKDTTIPAQDELSLLKSRADLMGITYSNNIGVDALKQKITDHMAGKAAEAAKASAEPEKKTQKESEPDQYELPLNEVTDEIVLRERIYKEKMFLVRVRINNLNPLKKDWPGELITVSNKYLGKVSKFIPFGEATDNGYHIPKIILDALKARKFNSLRTRKDKTTGVNIPESRWVPEFAIEELPYLTKEELDQLARQQAAAKGL